MTSISRLLAVVLTLLTVSCASRRPVPELAPVMDEAQRLLAEGCDACLRQALAIYERRAQQPGATDEAWRNVFRVTLLVMVRAKELGLPTDRLESAARGLAHQLRDVGAPTLLVPASTYIEAVSLVQGDTTGFDPDRRAERADEFRSRWTTDGTLPRARLELEAATADDIAAQYIALAIDCEDVNARKRIDAEQILGRYPTQLIEFRLALCQMSGPRLSALRQSNPRWVDTLLFEGRLQMAAPQRVEIARAAVFFADAHRAFPDSPSVTLALAAASNALGEYARSLELYDLVLELEATHRDALLGRVISLSYLERSDAAIAAATRVIDLGSPHRGAAHYWRAWNRYRLRQLPLAWDDIREATALSPDSAVLTLAGYIAYARQWPETAIDRLAQAFTLDAQNCDAVWTEGLVHVDREDWVSAAARFVTAVGCFTDSVESSKRTLLASRAAEESAESRRRVAEGEKRLATAEYRRAQAAYNAAASYARLARWRDAEAFIAIAAEHPLLKAKGLALKDSIPRH